MSRFIGFKLVAVLLLLNTGQGFAGTPIHQLEQLMSGFSNYSANFEQYTEDEKGLRGEVSKGSMNIKRPNSFRWKTITPFPQLIVSDGDVIWIYDPDLEQATRKKVSQSETNGPALILNGDVQAITEKFNVTQVIDREREKLFELLPKQEGNFEKIQLFFANGVIQELMLVDLFGKQTTIILTKAKINQKFKPGLFNFNPPPGIDVMTDQGDN